MLDPCAGWLHPWVSSWGGSGMLADTQSPPWLCPQGRAGFVLFACLRPPRGPVN